MSKTVRDMTRFQRVKGIITGLAMIAFALLLLSSPEEGYEAVVYVLAAAFIVTAVSMLLYYFTMARFMVGGRVILFRGIILLDLGVVTLTLTDVKHYYILIYLILIHAFSGLVEILRAQEERRGGASSYRLKTVHGILDIVMAILCIIFIRRMSIAVIVFSIGVIYSGVLRIISACRRTKFVYIQ